jgi:hypothetical protein
MVHATILLMEQNWMFGLTDADYIIIGFRNGTNTWSIMTGNRLSERISSFMRTTKFDCVLIDEIRKLCSRYNKI